MSSNEYLTEEEKKLYKISYSNNKALLEINDKLLKDEKIISDLEELMRLQVADSKVGTEIITSVTSTILMSLIFKYALNIDKEDTKTLICLMALLIGIYIYVTVVDMKETKDIKDILSKDYQDEDFGRYTRMKIADLKKEKKALLDVKQKIILRETEIRDILDNYQKIKEK